MFMSAQLDNFSNEPTLPVCSDVSKISYPWQEDLLPELESVTEIHPGFYWVRMPLEFGLESINLWLVDEGDSWTVVDTGLGDDRTASVWRTIFEKMLGRRPIKRVICTHLHPDHTGLAGWMCRKFPGAELWMSQLEYLTCQLIRARAGQTAPEGGVAFFRSLGWDDEAVEGYKSFYGYFGLGIRPLPESYRRLYEGMEFEMGGKVWKVLIGSGHSPEHACLFCPELNIVISGDQILPRISSNVSVNYTEPEANPLADWLYSCEKLVRALPADCLVLPAHNEPFFGAHVRLKDLVSKHEKSLRRLHEKLSQEPMTVPDTFVTLFARKIRNTNIGLATGEALAHLNCLIYRGKASKTLDENGIWYYQAVSPPGPVGYEPRSPS